MRDRLLSVPGTYIRAYGRRHAPEFQIDIDWFAGDLAMVGADGESVASALKRIAVKGAEHAGDVKAVGEAAATMRSDACEETDRVLARLSNAFARRGS